MANDTFVNSGKFFTRKPVLAAFLLLGFFPILFAFCFLFRSFTEVKQLREELLYTHQSALQSYPQRWSKKQFYETYSESNPYFLNEEVETLPLLQKEQEMLSQVCKYPLFQNNPTLFKRHNFLQKNRLSFSEEAMRTRALVKETEERQINPVEVDIHDLQRVLSLLEGIEIPPFISKERSPQILITDFHLEKIPDNDHFFLTTKLLKREFGKKEKSL